jgi:predicted nucleic acid-binding protein
MKPWVVDTCVLLDLVHGTDQQAADAEAVLAKAGSVVICPVSVVELGPTFTNPSKLRDFLLDYGIDSSEAFTSEDAEVGRAAWQRIIAARRATGAPRRPIADILIGAFAQRRNGIITRNGSDFTTLFPQLPVWVPEVSRPTFNPGMPKS